MASKGDGGVQSEQGDDDEQDKCKKTLCTSSSAAHGVRLRLVACGWLFVCNVL